MVQSEGNMSLKNPVTSLRIDLGTVRLVTQRLNHYATASPHVFHIPSNVNLFALHNQPSYLIVRTNENVFTVVKIFNVHVSNNSHSPTFSSFHLFIKYSFKSTVTATLNCYFSNNFSIYHAVWLTIRIACRSS
jgi:hypothetical protein